MSFEPLPPPARRCTPRRLARVSTLTALLFAGSAAAQGSPTTPQDKAAAVTIFERGIANMQANRLEQACPDFAESLRLYYAPGTLFTLAECEAKRGHIATALSRYDEYLALYETLSPEKKTAQGSRPRDSQAQKAALGPFVPKIVLVLSTDAPREMRVTLDGQEIPAAKLGNAIFVNPGKHSVTAAVPGGPTIEQRLTLVKGEERKIELKVKLPSAPPSAQSPAQAGAPASSNQPLAPSPSPPDASPGGDHVGAYIVGSVGIASLVLGCVAGGFVSANNRVIDANCTDGADGVKICRTIEGVEAGNQAKALTLVSMIGFGAGLAGLGGAAILLLTEPPPPPQASQTSRSIPTQVAKPRWSVSAGPLSDPKGGAMLRFQGVW